MLRSLGLAGLATVGTIGGVVLGGALGFVVAVASDPGDWVLDVGEPVVLRGDGVTATLQRRQVSEHGRVDERVLLTVQAEGKPDVGLEWRTHEPGSVTVDGGGAVWMLPGGREARVGWE